jgi:Ca-activated chloride channel family protein
MKQAKAALQYAIGRLNPGDRFNVVAFSTEARPFRDKLLEVDPETAAAAIEYVKGLEATGGTAIHDALLHALKLERVEGRVPIVIFLTDGQPTIGPTDTKTILHAAEKANGAKARLFVFGVGDNLNADLLTELASRNRGSGNFVSERENIEVKVSALVDKVASPVLTDLKLSIPDLGEHDVYPRALGDLFKGQQLVIVGRYGKQGARAITLSGRIGKREVSYVYEATFDDQARHEFLPRLWAVRKVGFLLDEIRRNGEQAELVAEIRKLGIRHGIVTPYTSFLVVEEEEMLRRRLGRFPASSPDGGQGGPMTPGAPEAEIRSLRERQAEATDARKALKKKEPMGRGAVAGARIAESLKDAEDAGEHSGVGVKTVGGKTFRLKEGVWVDTALEEFEKNNPDAPRKRVTYLGDDYDQLLADDRLVRFLAAGARVKFVFDGTIYEVVEE